MRDEIFERLKVVYKNTEFDVEYYPSSVVETGRGIRDVKTPIIEIQKSIGYGSYYKIGILFDTGDFSANIVSAITYENSYSLLSGILNESRGDDDSCNIYSIKKVEWGENDSFDTILVKIADKVCEATLQSLKKIWSMSFGDLILKYICKIMEDRI